MKTSSYQACILNYQNLGLGEVLVANPVKPVLGLAAPALGLAAPFMLTLGLAAFFRLTLGLEPYTLRGD